VLAKEPSSNAGKNICRENSGMLKKQGWLFRELVMNKIS